LLTRLPPLDLLAALKLIERDAGRRPGGRRWGPRELDLDLLVYSNEVLELPGLIVPHPGIAERNFVLFPLSDLAADLVIPGVGRVASLPVDASEPRISRLD
jgi:2-amino-4-hydroxy-6-hydroxymethyldihydropteridine diphosphokinase